MGKRADGYEIVILGSGLGGLIAGAMLSLKKRSVLLLREKGYAASLVKEGYRFIPFSNFSERCLRPSFIGKIARTFDLALLQGARRDSPGRGTTSAEEKEEQNFQVILPRARIDLYPERSALRREIRREFPREKEKIERFYDEVERTGSLLRASKSETESWPAFPARSSSWVKRWWTRKRFSRDLLDRELSTLSREFKEFIRVQVIAWSNLCTDRFPLPVVTPLLLGDEKVGRVSHPDVRAIEEKILQVFVRSGGAVQEIAKVEKLEKRWWKGFVLSLRGETSVVRSRLLILSSPLHQLLDLLEKVDANLLRWREKIYPRYAVLPLFMGIDEEAVPVGMKDAVASVMDFEKPYDGGNFLLLHLSPKGDKRWAPEGKRALTVGSLISMDREKSLSFDDHLKGVMRHIHHLFPFLEPYIEFTDWNWTKENFFCWSYPHFLFEAKGDPKWEKGVVPNRLARNLYFVGKENFPHLGLEGEALSGYRVGREILDRLKS